MKKSIWVIVALFMASCTTSPSPSIGVIAGEEGPGGEILSPVAGDQGGESTAGEMSGGNISGGDELGGMMGGSSGGTLMDIGCDLSAALENNGCTNSGCHAPPIQGELDLSSEGLEERLINAPSHTSGCQSRPLIDTQDPENSVFLQAVGVTSPPLGVEDSCQLVMPPSGEISVEDQECFQRWVVAVADRSQSLPTEELGPPPTLESALRKVKTLINGGELTSADIEEAERSGVQAVVESWTEQASFKTKMLDFFKVALQQKFEDNTINQLGLLRAHRDRQGMLEKTLEEVIPRTAFYLLEAEEDFSSIVSTKQWMMSTASLVALHFPDQTSDDLSQSHFLSGDAEEVPSTLNRQIRRRRWFIDGLDGTCDLPQREVLEMLLGYINRNRCRNRSRPYKFSETHLLEDHYHDWRLVTLEYDPEASDDDILPFYDITSLRNATEIKTRLPRVGYFTSSAFLNQWPTNVDNEFRVTVSQALISALHVGFVSTEPTEPLRFDAIDQEHSEPNSECYGCHRQLDPMRVYFAEGFNADYRLATENDGQGLLLDPLPQPAFTYRGQRSMGEGLDHFAEQIRSHPRFAAAWTQKLCLFANSAPCDESDQRFIDLRSRFEASGFNLKQLVIELMSSTLVTGLEDDGPQNTRPTVSITRRQHLCTLLSERTQHPDLCQVQRIQDIKGLIPEDRYARGAVDFNQPALPSPFFFAAAEALCEVVAVMVVDPDDPIFPSSDPEGSLRNMVMRLMSIPAEDTRFPSMFQALSTHYQSLVDNGSQPLDALRSAFTTACLSPDVMGIGL